MLADARAENRLTGRQHPGACPPVLDGEAIHVWRIGIGPDQPAEVVVARGKVLSVDERARASRFRTVDLRDRFVLCRGALRLLLGRYLDTAAESLVLEYGPCGKPALRIRPPSCVRTLEFNVSHSGDLALVAVARHRRVGIDVERVRTLPDADRLAHRFFAPAERTQYAALPAESRALGFFQCWTRKEAFVKATGEGLSRSLEDVEVSLWPGAPAQLLRVARPFVPGEWSLHSFQPAPAHTAAVAAFGSDVGISFFDF